MVIFLSVGYNSWTHKKMKRAFKTADEAKNFCEGLTDTNIYWFNGDNYIDAVNHLIGSIEFIKD